MKKFFLGVIKILITITFVLMIWMPGYFAVRSFFPMDRPEFGGLSFWDLVKHRGERFDEIAYAYEAATGKEPKYGMCIKVETSLIIAKAAPESMICGFMNTRDDWRAIFDNRADMRNLGCGVIEASWITAPKVGWEIFEKYLSIVLEGTRGNPVRYCRLGLEDAMP